MNMALLEVQGAQKHEGCLEEEEEGREDRAQKLKAPTWLSLKKAC